MRAVAGPRGQAGSQGQPAAQDSAPGLRSCGPRQPGRTSIGRTAMPAAARVAAMKARAVCSRSGDAGRSRAEGPGGVQALGRPTQADCSTRLLAGRRPHSCQSRSRWAPLRSTENTARATQSGQWVIDTTHRPLVLEVWQRCCRCTRQRHGSTSPGSPSSGLTIPGSVICPVRHRPGWPGQGCGHEPWVTPITGSSRYPGCRDPRWSWPGQGP